MKRILLPLLALAILPACSSKEVKPIDDTLEAKAKLGDTEIGINEDKEAVVQDSVPVEDELRALAWKNYEAERKLKAERDELVRCRTDLADPRLGGNRKLETIPELEISEDLGKVQEKLGITQSGRIKVVKKQFLTERFEKERQYRDSLAKLVKVLEDNRVSCERELGYVRVQHGLPAERYPALGYYGPQGNFIVTRPAERSLDDAFRILAEQTRKGKRLEKRETETETSENDTAIDTQNI